MKVCAAFEKRKVQLSDDGPNFPTGGTLNVANSAKLRYQAACAKVTDAMPDGVWWQSTKDGGEGTLHAVADLLERVTLLHQESLQRRAAAATDGDPAFPPYLEAAYEHKQAVVEALLTYYEVYRLRVYAIMMMGPLPNMMPADILNSDKWRLSRGMLASRWLGYRDVNKRDQANHKDWFDDDDCHQNAFEMPLMSHATMYKHFRSRS